MSTTYTLWIDGKSVGPLLKDHLLTLLSKGEVSQLTMCSLDGGKTWAPVSSVLAAPQEAASTVAPRKRRRIRTLDLVVILFGVAVAGLLTVAVFKGEDIRGYYYDWQQYNVITAHVRERLKSPSTARFSPMAETRFSGDTVAGWVDSQNALGATVRADFAGRVVGSNVYDLTITQR